MVHMPDGQKHATCASFSFNDWHLPHALWAELIIHLLCFVIGTLAS